MRCPGVLQGCRGEGRWEGRTFGITELTRSVRRDVPTLERGNDQTYLSACGYLWEGL